MDTTTFLIWSLGALGAYLLGAIPFGYLIARSRGVDIRTVGSRNTGATNVFRCVGKPWGIATFVLDLAKGAASCRLLPWVAAQLAGTTAGLEITPYHVLCGCLAVAGHNWPVFLGFRGGKGVATSAGLLLGLAPAGCGVALLAWLLTLAAARVVSLASIIAAIALGIAAWPLYLSVGIWFPLVLDGLAALAIWRHHANIQRLLAGTEPRLSLRKPPTTG
jgi:glycerol-3-phosphate acyltransferase PlsY